MVEVIADIGSSWATGLGGLETAKWLIREASRAGANTVKLQMFSEESLWRKTDPRHKKILPFCLPISWIGPLFDEAHKEMVNFLVTPFSPEAVGILVESGVVGRLKIASGDITYRPLLEEAGATELPILLSTGFATEREVYQAIDCLRERGSPPVTLLHCTGGYPTPPHDMNMRRVLTLKEIALKERLFGVGLSSHCREWWVDILAIAYGIECIEKHIALKGLLRGPEDGHSLSPKEFIEFVNAVRDAEWAMSEEGDFCPDDKYARENYRRNPKDWLRPVTMA